MLTYISNTGHYIDVLSRVQSVKHMLWIGTADIKDLYVEDGKQKKHFLAVLAGLIRRGVEVRLIHAKEPGTNFCKTVYVGSANLMGAGIGMKTDNKRNFEAGILTDESEIVEQAMKQFDEVWMGNHCKTCKRRDYCSDPIV